MLMRLGEANWERVIAGLHGSALPEARQMGPVLASQLDAIRRHRAGPTPRRHVLAAERDAVVLTQADDRELADRLEARAWAPLEWNSEAALLIAEAIARLRRRGGGPRGLVDAPEDDEDRATNG